MARFDQAAIELFTKKAGAVSTIALEKDDMAAAVDYALDICLNKEPLRPMMAMAAPDQNRMLAAPKLSEADFQLLAQRGAEKGVAIIKDGLRNHLAGIDLALTYADLGVADTATCVLGCPDENERLATMIAELHIMILPKSKLVMDIYQAEDCLRSLLGHEAMYAAFISGCSRTSDIERILTLGVHGPLELHVVLLNS
jgi:L-lactate dehydrogenase complex protein LldG